MRALLESPVIDNALLKKAMKFQAEAKTLGAAVVMLNEDGVVQAFDAGGASRNVTLPARAQTNDGQVRFFYNASTPGENLVIKNSVATTLLTLPPSGVAMVIGSCALEAPATREWVAVQIGGDGLAYNRRIPIIADGAAVVLTAADSGGLVVMDLTTGSLTTLPEITAYNIGMTFEFQWPVSYASGTQKIITGAAADLIVGTISKFDIDTLTDPLSVESFNGSTHIALIIDAVTDGGLLGSWLRFTAISATQWMIQGRLHHSGNVSATVSTT